MNIKAHLEAAWQNTLKYIGPVILLTLAQVVVSVCSLGIMAPVTFAGYLQSLLRAVREGRSPELGDLFSEMALFLPLFAFFLLAAIASMIGFLLLVLPGFAVVALLTFSTMYMLPLMIDRRLGLIEAIRQSWQMATRPPLTDQIVVALIYIVIISIGGTVPCGFLVTQPLAMFLLLSVYLEKMEGSPEEAASQAAAAPAARPADLPPPPPPSPEQAVE